MTAPITIILTPPVATDSPTAFTAKAFDMLGKLPVLAAAMNTQNADNNAAAAATAASAAQVAVTAGALSSVNAALAGKADAKTRKNLFNPADAGVVVGSAINQATGELSVAAGFRATGYISVITGSSYAISSGRGYAWYAENKSFISGALPNPASVPIVVVAPAGAAFFRVGVADGQLATFQVELGSISTAYEPYGMELTTPLQANSVSTAVMQNGAVTADKLASGAVTADKVASGAVTADKLAAGAIALGKSDFSVASRNLYDKSVATVGFYVGNTSAVPMVNAAYDVTDYIAVTPGSTYSLSGTGAVVRFVAYFDSAKALVAGGKSSSVDGVISQIVIPAGVLFVRISFAEAGYTTFQFELGSAPTAYVAFGHKINSAVLPDAGAPEVVMPPYIYGVQGREMNVYFDNIHVSSTSKDWAHDVTATGAGQQQNERFTWVPTGSVTAGTVSIAVHDKRTGAVLTQGAAQQRAAALSAGAGMNKKLLLIGDSLVNAGVITQTLIDIAATDSMSLTLLGTRGTGSNRHEGRGGWSIATYTSSYSDGIVGANPFWIGGGVNVTQYLANNSMPPPDCFAVHLGINDAFAYTSDSAVVAAAATAFASLDILISSAKAAGPGVNVALLIPPPPSSDQDAFGFSYGAGQTRWRYKRNILIWARELIARYSGQESARIYLVPTNTALDVENNMQRSAPTVINSRSAVTTARQNNGVHPADSGYAQMADVLWAFLKCKA